MSYLLPEPGQRGQNTRRRQSQLVNRPRRREAAAGRRTNDWPAPAGGPQNASRRPEPSVKPGRNRGIAEANYHDD